MTRGKKVKQLRNREEKIVEPPVDELPQIADPFERYSRPLQLGAFLAILGIYASTLYPSVPGGDSGELIIAAQQLGVAHPPGYPLFTLLGKVFTWLPTGSIAWRVNLLTAVLGALAATVLMRATWKLTASLGAGLFAGGVFAFSPLVWRYSIQAEVFSLNNLFAAILVSALVSFETRPGERSLYWFCFWFGLGLTNHHTLLFCGVPFGLWLLYRAPRSVYRWPRVLLLPACGAAGFVPYVYLFLSPADHPSTTWGDTSTLPGFWSHFRREQYGTFQLGTMEQEGTLWERLAAYFAQLPGELALVAPVLALLVILLLATRRLGVPSAQARVLKVVLLTLAFYLIVFTSMSKLSLADPFWHEVFSRFWQQANLLVCVVAGAGLSRLPRLSHPGVAVVALGVVALQIGLHYGNENQRNNRMISEFAEQILDDLPPHALVISKGDLHWNSLRYKQVCEGMRPDVRILDLELLKAPWMNERVRKHFAGVSLPGRRYRAPARATADSYDLQALFDANVARLPILSNALEHGDAGWKAAYSAWPEGFLDRVRPQTETVDIDRFLAETDRWDRELKLSFPTELPAGSWGAIARREHRNLDSRRGNRLLAEALAGPIAPRHVRRAALFLERAIEARDEPSADLYLNLGIGYYMLRDEDAAAVRNMVRAWETYLQIAPQRAPQRALVSRVLQDPENASINLGVR